ncbi:hypothetical protein [Rhizobium lentis]|uniref:Uncharacterized protein n=1 Tax=Rhizobium lentis TaxID=1138194 RepID=A0A7W9CX78_9HYPH|nr:hypothetical protein [Rhizobium lentis]MBB4576456.1 hypothetical protein [Rhizobium lentis]MBB5552677.1 hypothetical protein [Rhizobium lentis]MBB5563217.1 hypothetical protein [Rhizobium lentis]MBB5569494.1 hypothetical protein [Rhizobium lentis]
MAAGLKSLHIFSPQRGKKAHAFRNPEAGEFRDSEVGYFLGVLLRRAVDFNISRSSS